MARRWPPLVLVCIVWAAVVMCMGVSVSAGVRSAAAAATPSSRGFASSPPPPPPVDGDAGVPRGSHATPPPPPPAVESFVPVAVSSSGLDDSGARGALLRFSPPSLDFRRQPVCIATVQTVHLTHMGVQGDEPVELAAVRPWSGQAGVVGARVADGDEEGQHFLTPMFEPQVLHPGNSTTLQVILLPRAIGVIEGTLMVESTGGVTISYPLRAEGVANPYSLAPLTDRLPVGAALTRSVSLYNPHRDVMHVKEVFTTEGFLHLTLPDSPRQHGTRLSDAGTRDDSSWMRGASRATVLSSCGHLERPASVWKMTPPKSGSVYMATSK